MSIRWIGGGNSVSLTPRVILAPEAENLRTIPMVLWKRIAGSLDRYCEVIVIGVHRYEIMENTTDIRGLTTVPVIAKVLAEATAVITSNSLPWHLARHAGTPTWCFSDVPVARCATVDMPSFMSTSENWESMVDTIKLLIKHPKSHILSKEMAGKLANG